MIIMLMFLYCIQWYIFFLASYEMRQNRTLTKLRMFAWIFIPFWMIAEVLWKAARFFWESPLK